jgi:hypothetical protein
MGFTIRMDGQNRRKEGRTGGERKEGNEDMKEYVCVAIHTHLYI